MEEKKTLLFIFNPFSGKAQIKNQLMDIVDTMVKAGYEVTIYPTQAPEDAIHKVEVDAEKYDLVVCSGGDGTLDEVVSGIMHKGFTVPLGYIPAGSTNDFATSLGIPKDMVKALDEIHKASAGIPRMVNRICEKALMYAFQNQKRLIDDYMIKFVIEHEMLGTITT